jgi:hypothetical protein
VDIRLAWLAAAAAALASGGDLLMLYVAHAARPELGLGPVPAGLLTLGGVLGVLAIPLYALGYRAAGGLAASAGEAPGRAIVALGTAAALAGALIHGLTALHIRADLAAGAPVREPLAAVAAWGLPILVLWGAAALMVLAASVLFVGCVLRARGRLPRALALANPALLTVLLALPGVCSSLAAAFLTPAAPNLAHGLFFLACGLAARRPRR